MCPRLRNFNVCLCLFALVGGLHSFAIEVDEGFNELPWGSSEDFVKKNAKGTLQSRHEIKNRRWNNSHVGIFSNMVLGPSSVLLQYTDKYSEMIEYYFSGNKLCLVIHRPPYTKSFDPLSYVAKLDQLYKEKMRRKKYKDLLFPASWGRYDMRTEYPLTLQWENENSFIRLACKSWPGEEMREIKAVIYSSVKLKVANSNALKDPVNPVSTPSSQEKSPTPTETPTL